MKAFFHLVFKLTYTTEIMRTFFSCMSVHFLQIAALKSALKKGGSPADAIQTKRNVSFNSLTVREYEMTLGGT